MRLRPGMTVEELVGVYRKAGAFNGGRLAEACDLFGRMIDSGATIALTVTGAMTPAGMGGAIQAMIEAGFVDLIISTGANVYHDLHFALKLPVVQGHFQVDDKELYRAGIERIYDIFITEDSLLDTDAFVREALEKAPKALRGPHLHPAAAPLPRPARPAAGAAPGEELRRHRRGVGRAHLHQLAGRLLHRHERSRHEAARRRDHHRSRPGRPGVDRHRVRRRRERRRHPGRRLAQELLPPDAAHPLADPRPQPRRPRVRAAISTDSPQWGGLSGATPSEAISWGKVQANMLKNHVVLYSDTTVAAPLVFAYALSTRKKRKPKRLYRRLPRDVRGAAEGAHEEAPWLGRHARGEGLGQDEDGRAWPGAATALIRP